MNTQDLYLEYTDPSGSKLPVIQCHRVWDKERFLSSQCKAYMQDVKQEARRIVSVSTRDAYMATKG